MNLYVKTLIATVLGMTAFSYLKAAGVEQHAMCAQLQRFVTSVKKGETRKLEFHTSWGTDFRDTPTPHRAISAARCVHAGYAPAEAVCDYLMRNGSVEFAGSNAKAAIVCLSPGTKFDNQMQLENVEANFSYGSENRGEIVNIVLAEDTKIGGMLLTVSVDGY